jgi:3-oxoacyl-[acyl-carrier protein] reductase
MLLKDRVAIVTGAARGMGKAISLKFADEGCNIVIADLLEDEAQQTAAEVKTKGREAIAVKCDQTKINQVKNVVDKTINKFGKVDILVNTAGIGAPLKSIADYTEEEWDQIFAVHVKGPFFFSKFVAPYMKQQKSGNIINFSTSSALHTPSGRHHYTSAKAAVIGLTLNLAVELGVYNIRVNVIIPGAIATSFHDITLPQGVSREKFFSGIGSHVLLGRIGTPEDIAGVALFLASDLSAYVTGQQMLVGGGMPLGRPHGAPPVK